MKRLTAVIAMVVVLMFPGAAPAIADPTNTLCNNFSWRSLHENECEINNSHRPPGTGGGGSDGGLIGRIIKGIGGLLGGGGLL